MSEILVTYEGNLRAKGSSPELKDAFITDSSKDFGGLGIHFSPTDLLIGALASCMLTYMGVRAAKLGINIEGTSIRALKELTHKHQITKIRMEIDCPVPVDPYSASEFEKAAYQCPLQNSLHPGIQREYVFKWRKTSDNVLS